MTLSLFQDTRQGANPNVIVTILSTITTNTFPVKDFSIQVAVPKVMFVPKEIYWQIIVWLVCRLLLMRDFNIRAYLSSWNFRVSFIFAHLFFAHFIFAYPHFFHFRAKLILAQWQKKFGFTRLKHPKCWYFCWYLVRERRKKSKYVLRIAQFYFRALLVARITLIRANYIFAQEHCAKIKLTRKFHELRYLFNTNLLVTDFLLIFFFLISVFKYNFYQFYRHFIYNRTTSIADTIGTQKRCPL